VTTEWQPLLSGLATAFAAGEAFPVISRRQTGVGAKQLAKITGTAEAGMSRNVGDGSVGADELLLRLLQPDIGEILDEGLAGCLLEDRVEMAAA